MKSIKYLKHCIYFLFLLCISCQNAEDELSQNPEIEGKVFTYTMKLNADYMLFEGENTTRATSSDETGHVPVTYDFSQSGVFNQFTVVDANSDGKTWTLSSGKARYSYHSTNVADDWLITSAIHLDKGKTYELKYGCYASNSSRERMEVYLSTSATKEGMNRCLISPYDLSTSSSSVKSIRFTITSESNDYYIGFHAISPADLYSIYITTISLNETPDSRSSHWNDGDQVYLSFQDNGTTQVGSATYSAADSIWNVSVSSSTGLTPNKVNNCAIYYVRGESPSISSDQITLDEKLAVFLDQAATYTVTGNMITLSAALKPLSWRLCFKGQTNQSIQIASTSGIQYYSKLNLTSNQFSTAIKDISLSVQNDGFTPYIHGVIPSDDNTLTLVSDDVTYTRTINSDLLRVGKSGYFTIPTKTSHNGWASSADTPTDSHQRIDIGMKDAGGNIIYWSDRNLGAATPEETGDYYAWGETATKTNFTWATYQWCNGTSKSMTKYCTNATYGTVDNLTTLEPADDAAHNDWGEHWRIPTFAEMDRLIQECTWTWTQRNGMNGYKITGPNNGYIFLPAVGMYSKQSLSSQGVTGEYWTSSLIAETPNIARTVWFDSGNVLAGNGGMRYYGFTIRPVYVESADAAEGSSQDITIDGYGSDTSLDDTGGSGGVDNTGSQDITIDGYDNENCLDDTGGESGVDHISDQDLSIDGYGSDQCLD